MHKPERSIVSMLARRFRSRAVVELENLALRHQLHVLRRQRPGRLRLFAIDRLLPATVIQWHRKGFRLFWHWRSRSGRPSVEREIRDLIRRMSSANPLWGAPRIHGEMLKLGIEVSQATVAKYMVRRRGAPSQNWKTFLRNHAEGIAAIDMFVEQRPIVAVEGFVSERRSAERFRDRGPGVTHRTVVGHREREPDAERRNDHVFAASVGEGAQHTKPEIVYRG